MNQSMPVSGSQRSSAKDVFEHLLTTATLYVSVISFIALLWQYINAYFPDELNFYYTSIQDIVRQSMATLIVVWPVYIFMSWLIAKNVTQGETRQVKIRKWLFYLTLFIAAVTLIVDLVSLIYEFLDGELTIQFFLKIAVVFVVAGLVFGYYLWDLNRPDDSTSKLPKRMAIGLSILTVATIVAGFWIIGSPATQRARRFDEQRVYNLQSLQSEIINYWTQKRVLPASLTDLTNTISGFSPPTDPITEAAYGYNIKETFVFELCADFQTDSKDNSKQASRPTKYYGQENDNWMHSAGRYCFSRMIDPDLYKNPDVKPYPVR